MDEKNVVVFCFVFLKYLKNGSNYFIKKKKKKIERTMAFSSTKKSLMREHRKNYILRDINDFDKMSVSMLPNFVYALAQKLV